MNWLYRDFKKYILCFLVSLNYVEVLMLIKRRPIIICVFAELLRKHVSFFIVVHDIVFDSH